MWTFGAGRCPYPLKTYRTAKAPKGKSRCATHTSILQDVAVAGGAATPVAIIPG